MRTERPLCLRNQSDLVLGGKNYELADEKLVRLSARVRPSCLNISLVRCSVLQIFPVSFTVYLLLLGNTIYRLLQRLSIERLWININFFIPSNPRHETNERKNFTRIALWILVFRCNRLVEKIDLLQILFTFHSYALSSIFPLGNSIFFYRLLERLWINFNFFVASNLRRETN